jgi:hypothetical protein
VATDEEDGEVGGEEQEERGGGGPAAAAGRGAPEVGGAEEGFQRRHGPRPRPGCAVLVLCASLAGPPGFAQLRGFPCSVAIGARNLGSYWSKRILIIWGKGRGGQLCTDNRHK